jgi:hypothetical protein
MCYKTRSMRCTTRGSWGAERDTALSDVDMPLIQIPSDGGLSLIVKWPAGCAYFNQTGGHSCQQSWAEGILVPIPAPTSATQDRLYEMFGPESEKYGGNCYNRIDGEDADRIDALLATHHHAFEGQRIHWAAPRLSGPTRTPSSGRSSGFLQTKPS